MSEIHARAEHGGQHLGFVPAGEEQAKAKGAHGGHGKVEGKNVGGGVFKNDTISASEHLKNNGELRGRGLISQNDLDQLTPGDPRLLGHKGQVSGKLPAGPSGASNPFFNPNPMTAFFRGFFSVIQLMKENQLVGSKLASMEMSTMKEMGNAQARSQLEAGKAQAKGEYIQAIMAGVNAGIGVGMMGMKLGALNDAKKEANAGMKAKENDVADAEKELAKAKEPQAQPLAKIRAQEQKASELENAMGKNAKKDAKVTGQEELKATKTDKTKSEEKDGETKLEDTENAQNKSKLEKEHDSLEVKLSEEKNFKPLAEPKPFKPKSPDEISKMSKEDREAYLGHEAETKAFAEQKAAYQKLKDLPELPGGQSGTAPKPPEMQLKELRENIAKDKAEFKKADNPINLKIAKAEENLKKATAERDQYKANFPNTIQSIMSQNRAYIVSEALGQALQQGTQVGTHVAAGWAAQQAAYWNAQATIFGVDGQIQSKGLDLMMGMKQDSDSTVASFLQTLNKLSDSEQSSMHWAVA